MIKRVSDSNNYEFKDKWSKKISGFAWNAAKSFALIWNQNNTCQMGTEFNVGESDLMNSEYCYFILTMALDEKSSLTYLNKKSWPTL